MSSPFTLRDLSVHYDSFKALDNVNLCLEAGKSLALLGPNGAGKSTLTRVLLGQQAGFSGECKVFGEAPGTFENKRRIGVTPQVLDFPKHVTIYEILNFVSQHYNSPSNSLQKWIDKLDFKKLLKRQTHEMSFGQRRLIAIVIAFLGDPDFVILDEPTVGLDVDVRIKIWDAIKEYQTSGGSLLITTHHLEEAEELSTHISVLNKGRIIESGTVRQIKEKFGFRVIRFQSKNPPKHINPIKQSGGFYELVSNDTDTELKRLIAEEDISNIEVHPVSLQDAFLNILGETPTNDF
tara:strand:- start:12262 stop:13140 length:879 start_codon:yes stop_codon:yes gene_type:complete